MAFRLISLRHTGFTAGALARGLVAATIAVSLSWGGVLYAANQSVQGAKKTEDVGFDGDAPTAILIEASSGSVLFEKNADELRAPSSMMKLVTAEVVFNAIKKGDVKLTDEYRISENAWRKGGAPSGGSTMFAAINSKVSVDDLLHGAIIQSGNDACIALAEGIAGNERIFASDFMTKRARELGMTKSTFANSNGLPDPGNKMTVRELGMLARHIILDFPEFYKLFGEKEFTWNKIRQPNRNPLLNSMEGADGLKTGYTKEGGYGMVGSAVQNGTRLIVVVNGLEDIEDRATEAKKMLEWGFRNFETRTLIAADQQVGYAKVFGGESRSVKLVAKEPVKVMVHKSGGDKLIARVVYNGPVRAPVQAGQQVGVVRVWRSGNIAVETPVYAAEAVRHRLDRAARDRWRQRARDRHVPRRRREALIMSESTGQRPSGRGRFITFEGGEGTGKSTQIKKLADRLGAARLRTLVTREPGGSPGAEIMRHLVLSGHGQAARPRGRDAAVCGRPRRPCPHRDRACAQAGRLGPLRPLRRLDAGLSGQPRQRARRADQCHAAGHDRRSQAGPHHHPRFAGRDRLGTRGGAARQRHARQVRGREARLPSGPARGLSQDRRGRACTLRADRRQFRS